MNLFRFNVIRKNKLLVIIALILFSLLSVSMPHGSVETYHHHHHQHESLFKQVMNNNKPEAKLKKILKKIKTFLLSIISRLPQILSNTIVLTNIRLVLFNLQFSKVSILDLFSFLCSYFHGSKFKHSMKHSDSLPLMAV